MKEPTISKQAQQSAGCPVVADLGPCPWCGMRRPNVYLHTRAFGRTYYRVSCDCGKAPETKGKTINELKEKWRPEYVDNKTGRKGKR